MKKNITKNIPLLLAICLSMLATETAFAQQGNGNAKKDANQVAEDARDQNQRDKSAKQNNPSAQKREKARAKADNANNPQGNQGNAYGQDKGDLTGREFGQARAADAQLMGEQKREELGRAVDEGDKKIRDSNERIARAKNDIEKDRQTKKISDAEYNEKKAKIERAERAVKGLEEKVNNGRRLGATKQ